MKAKGFGIAALCAFLAGCGSITVPVKGTSSAGETFAGTAAASISSGKFEVSTAAGVRCSGTYDPLATAKRISVPVTCSDGRSGTVDVIRDNDLMGGVGTATFSNGTTAKFVFGKDRLGS